MKKTEIYITGIFSVILSGKVQPTVGFVHVYARLKLASRGISLIAER